MEFGGIVMVITDYAETMFVFTLIAELVIIILIALMTITIFA